MPDDILTKVDRMGFGIPMDQWLLTSLRGWDENLLDEKRLQLEGFFDAMLVREEWKEHQMNATDSIYYGMC